MAKLKNPPPKRVRLTKNLGNETRKFLNWLDFRMRIATSLSDYHDLRRQCADELCALRANWNTWWDQEKRKRRKRICDPAKDLHKYWRDHYEV